MYNKAVFKKTHTLPRHVLENEGAQLKEIKISSPIKPFVYPLPIGQRELQIENEKSKQKNTRETKFFVDVCKI